MRSEVSQREKDKYVISLIGGILKNDTNEFIKKKNRNKLTDIENKLMVTKGEGSGGRIN